MKATVPGLAGGNAIAVEDETVAVKVTGSPGLRDGFAEETSAVVVLDLLTTWPPETAPLLAVNEPSPR
jgi:hypothetical protein